MPPRRAHLAAGCGTTPQHIAALRTALDALPETLPAALAAKPAAAAKPAVETDDAFLRKLRTGQRVIAVELDSPKDADLTAYLEGARRLQTAGADLLTIADCPIARARMDSSLVACRVHRELGMNVLPHMTCRDRNLNATKALLLGLYAEGVREVLAITGDPIPTAERDEVKNVYQFNSRKLAQYIVSLAGEGREMPAPITVFGALNLNARNFEVELRRAAEKLENGMSGFLTQPVLSAQAVENLKKARETLGERAKILAGILPVVSQRNAIFMENEVNGIHVDDAIIQRFEGLDRAAGEELGLEVSVQAAKAAAPYADGFYLMTPFNRVALMERLIARLRTEVTAEKIKREEHAVPCEKPLLSIIVPVYKVENYLQKCIDSILAQTFTDFELILVEDGSPDGCPALCDAAAAKDARIRVLHQKNGGLSAARNAGLDVARGEWIGFVDSDDYIAPEMYETLYKAVQSTGADLALCDYAAVDEAGIPCLPPYTGLAQRIFTGRELLKRATNTMAQPAWNKLYRRAIFAQLRYPEGKLNEDIFVLPEICLNTKKAVVVPKELYYYVQRGSSIMNGSKTLRHFDAAEAAQRYWNCLVENEVYDALANAAKFTMGSVSRVYRQLPPALRKAPRSREMLRMQFDVVDRTRQYCTVPAGLWLQSLLLRLFPREYMWLRNIKGRGELKIA